jgi:RNA polymerase sigma factor (sigma-70 family)
MAPLLANRSRTDRSFERLYQRHVGDVYRYALAVLRNEADAEDVTQTTFLNAYRAYQKGERPQVAHNWLIAIAHNVCRQRFRQSARRPLEVEFDDEIAGQPDDDDLTPTAEDIRRALGHLAFNQRAALVMRELEGRSYAEIAEILDVSVSAVETLIFRARRALREQLEGALTCGEAELAISRQLDGRLSRAEKGQLRAHLRECSDCATFARRQRAQRTALKSLAAVPLPSSLATFFGGGGAAVGTGVAIKAAAVLAAGAIVGGAGYEAANKVTHHRLAAPAPAPAVSKSSKSLAPPRVDRTMRTAPASFSHAAVVTPNHGAAARGAPPGQAVRQKHATKHAKQHPVAKTKARTHARTHAQPRRVRAHGAPAQAHRQHARPQHERRVHKRHVRKPRPHPLPHPHPQPKPHGQPTAKPSRPSVRPSKPKSETDALPTETTLTAPDTVVHGKK